MFKVLLQLVSKQYISLSLSLSFVRATINRELILTVISLYNYSLLKDLQKQLSSWSYETCIGKTFVTMVPKQLPMPDCHIINHVIDWFS